MGNQTNTLIQSKMPWTKFLWGNTHRTTVLPRPCSGVDHSLAQLSCCIEKTCIRDQTLDGCDNSNTNLRSPDRYRLAVQRQAGQLAELPHHIGWQR